ncbi:MAG: aminotransferase class V-fold PLP-dependent enzyme [Flavobacteriaceae bacterium]
MDKRTFLKQLGSTALLTPFLPYDLRAISDDKEGYPSPDTEDFWLRIRRDYALKPDYINLENGYYCITPRPTLKKYFEHIEEINLHGSYYMRTVQWDNKKRIAQRLAKWLGCGSDELIITRNTTESLDMIISGFPWKAGDEAIYARQDYGSMIDQFEMIGSRYGVVNKVISVPNHPESDDEIVALYEQEITSKTKLIMLCHMINITGHILPVKKICEMAHRYGVEVMVDGAHCVGHIDVDIGALGCDYYASSLHKWLSVPLGAGILYVSRKNIPKIWPLLAEHEREEGGISRLNHTGTHPVYTDLAIADALDYLDMIGLERKEKRLRYLQRYWSEPLREVSGLNVNTPKELGRSCGIGNIGVKHIEPLTLAKTLLEEYKIFTVAIDQSNVHGCRITPNIYTTTAELDRFIEVMTSLSAP